MLMEHAANRPRRMLFWLTLAVVAAIAHIVTTLWLAAPRSGGGLRSFYSDLPRNAAQILPMLGPQTQKLPFMMPETLYAVCAFDIVDNPLRIHAELPETRDPEPGTRIPSQNACILLHHQPSQPGA